ncbi:hypothetical protein BCR32DRAFT_247751 [Anaeromyces robustus]|uniref:Right handed beta helix domain-containing protein n=1 Tax=Anaeromyces robustus TaxID=1754192 RepID=A0A1Y1WVT7_9FUNG|nr:hypothetical protein BCR32DRAFT_247751 [Anaeromyces robustus]|eukprot:ORX77657.1 hypothetical protein BCR32DRAFT_247751 [Anaeromyces robustus]
MSNNRINNIINNNKFDCGGIQLNNDITANIKISNFTNNNSKSNGGVICINNLSSLKLDLISNRFINNKAINGGAIYLSEGDIKNLEINNKSRIITSKNNIFKENIALDFGGAIYYNSRQIKITNFESNEIILNKAGIMGGGVYFEELLSKEEFKGYKFTLNNNTVSSYIDNYTSKPAYITLDTNLNKNSFNITTGDYFPLSFSLYDKYDNLIVDITKYYSFINLKVLLEEKNPSNSDNNSNISLKGNIGLFVHG